MSSPSKKDVKELLEKTRDYDADERFMAMLGIIEHFKSTQGTIELSLQAPVRDCILRLLDDGNSNVSTAAVKCLSQIITRLNSEHVSFIIDRLGVLLIQTPNSTGLTRSSSSSNNGANENDQPKLSNRDIVTDGLQTILASVSSEVGKMIAPKLVKSILTGLSTPPKKDIDVEMSSLSILKDLLEKFGNELALDHESIKNTLVKLLTHPSDPIKKRTSATLGPLVQVLNDTLFQSLMQTLLHEMDSNQPEVYVHSLSIISRSAGVRVGTYLPSIIPRLLSFLTLTAAERSGEEPEEKRIEMLETSLQAIESTLSRCPTQITPYVQRLVNVGMEWSSFDPMYSYDNAMDEEEDGERWTNEMGKSVKFNKPSNNHEEVEENEEIADDSNEGAFAADDDDDWGGDNSTDMNGVDSIKGDGWGGEDEETGGISGGSNDTSWKVRRAAVGVLSSFIKARADLLKEYYDTLCSHLVSRFKERDSAVKEELLLCCRDLLRETIIVSSNTIDKNDSMIDDTTSGIEPIPLTVRTRSTYVSLDKHVENIAYAVEKQFTNSDIRTQKAIFAVLYELGQVRRGKMADYFPLFIPHILTAIEASGKYSEINTDALQIAHLFVESHTFDELSPYLSSITSSTIKCVKSGQPKNIPAALHVLSSIIKSMKGNIIESVVKNTYNITYSQLEQKDVPLDIKLSSIHLMAVLLSSSNDLLSKENKDVWNLFIERMNNETTRQSTLRAITKIANQNPKINLNSLVSHIDTMLLFLRQSSHHLKHDTVKCIDALLKTHPKAFNNQQINAILSETAPLISEEDLQLSHLVLDLTSTILTTQPIGEDMVNKLSVDRAILLACSPVLQGIALNSLLSFFQHLILNKSTRAVKNKNNSFSSLLSSLLSRVDTSLNRVAFSALAKCIAAITTSTNEKQTEETLNSFITNVTNDISPSLTHLSLLVLGECGRQRDLQSTNVENVCVKAFDSKDESVRQAAAYALGNITTGNLQYYLPQLLKMITNQPKHSYLLFSALKEIITLHSTTQTAMIRIRPYLSSIIPLLFTHAESKDDATRSMVSECIGKVTVIDPATILPRLVSLMSNKSVYTVAVVPSSLRFAFTPLMDWSILSTHLPSFLPLLTHSDLEVRRQSVWMIDVLVRINVEVLSKDYLSTSVLPALYNETKPHPELIHEVDYGAFKKTLDDGLPLRKTVFQSLNTIIQYGAHRIHLPTFFTHIRNGITDPDTDVQVTTYNTISYMASHHAAIVLENLDTLPKTMMTPIKGHINASKGKEGEQSIEVLRSCLRCMLTSNLINGVEVCTSYTHFFKQVMATPILVSMLREMNLQMQT